MNAQELRIGNLVHGPRQKEAYPVIEISKSSAQIEFKDGYDWFGCDQLHGVPLTEEWLLRFGFEEQTKEWNDARWFQIHSEVTWTFWMDTMAIYSSGDHWIAKCIYVHQLQNLFFALTETELTLK